MRLLLLTITCFIFHPRITQGLQPSRIIIPTRKAHHQPSRRGFLASALSIVLSTQQFPSSTAYAAETIGKDKNCNDSSCLGIWDGLLADCPHEKKFLGGAGCTASQDDTPGIFSEPWDYSDASSLDWQDQMPVLKDAIALVAQSRGDQVRTVFEQGRYLRVVFVDGKTDETSVGEFYFTPSDSTVQFRVASQSGTSFQSLKNIERCELIRKKLRYEKLPVLRNRKRTLFFVESDLDTFGPGSAALGPPAEMKTGELDGRYSENVDPRLKIDLLQQFPRQ